MTSIAMSPPALLLACCLSLSAGCAGAPPREPAADPGIQATGSSSDLDPSEAVLAARRAGYKIVDRDGRQLYCRREKVTGSHLRQQTTCLTAAELQELQDATRRSIDSMTRKAPPPQGT